MVVFYLGASVPTSYTAMINPVVAAPVLTLSYTGFVPSCGSVALGSATHQRHGAERTVT